MNITFLIGNGFDLNLGLKTRYTDFLKVYKASVADDGKGVRFLKEQMCDEETSPLWSNAEVAFGLSTAQYKEKGLNADDFIGSHEDFCVHLADYLSKEQKRIDFIELKPQIVKGFVSALKNYTKGFREAEEMQIKQTIDVISGGFTYNFINFNYTDTLDQCISAVRVTKDVLGTRRYSNTNYGNSIGKSIHVHGTITSSMVLGVNDATQIADSSIFDGYGEEYISSLIKQHTNEMNRENTDQKAFDILKTSDLIYVYGMSTGITDKLWWERICQMMREKKTLHLILHMFEAPKPGLTMRPVVTFEKKSCLNFMSYFDFDESEKEGIEARMHIDSSNIFEGLKDLAVEPQKVFSQVSAVIS